MPFYTDNWKEELKSELDMSTLPVLWGGAAMGTEVPSEFAEVLVHFMLNTLLALKLANVSPLLFITT